MNKPDPEFSAWDDAKFSVGGLLVLALPFAFLLALFFLF